MGGSENFGASVTGEPVRLGKPVRLWVPVRLEDLVSFWELVLLG